MLLGSLDSDADASVVIAIHRQSSPMAQTATKLHQSYRHYHSHHSVEMRPQEDYTLTMSCKRLCSLEFNVSVLSSQIA